MLFLFLTRLAHWVETTTNINWPFVVVNNLEVDWEFLQPWDVGWVKSFLPICSNLNDIIKLFYITSINNLL